MGRIVLSTVGIRGDLNPFIAIGGGLRARGHDVVFAVEGRFRTAVADEGFPCWPLAGDVLEALSPHVGAIVRGLTPIASVGPIVREWLAAGVAAKVEDLVAACAGADLLVARAAHLAAPIAAERLGIPWVQVTMTALTVPSAHVDPRVLPVPWARPPRLANRAAWAAIELVARRLADRPVNEVRRGLGLPAARDVMGRGGQSRHLTAVAVSPSVSPPRADWPAHVRTTGYCFWDVPASWREPEALTAFLDRPGPVVAISFGSMSPFVGGALSPLYGTAVDAVLAAGARALAIGGAPEALAGCPEERVLALPFAPFSLVHPRCAAAIHHGGPYTAGEALRAGIPALAVPWGIDQFFTAAELDRTGAVRVRHHRRFRGATARRDVAALLEDRSYRECAAMMAGRIAAEDGVGTFCDAVERVVERRRGWSRT